MERSILTVVSPAETPRNPWGLPKLVPCSLASVMDEEMAKEQQDKENFCSKETALERPLQSTVDGKEYLNIASIQTM